LEAHHRKILHGMEAIRQHCQRPVPDIVELGTARLSLSRASTARAQYVRDIAIPTLLEQGDDALHAEISDLERGISVKRLASSEHVTTWSSQAIAEDWDGYRNAARAIWAMMEEQIERERRVLGERLTKKAL
jgi:hypothetical protein